MMTGRRQYGPIVFTKRIDRSSPLLAQALAQNQVIDAIFRFYRPTPSGMEQQYYTITIERGRVSSISTISPDVLTVEGAKRPAIEEVGISFTIIERTFEIGGVSFRDNREER